MEINLQDKFPHMRPVKRPPTLFTFNGCGVTVYGKRDFDAETGAYIKTQFIVLVFIPILALGAYRVADAQGGGWYFIGKEPLSALAKGWSCIVAFCVLTLIGSLMWESHAKSPEYRAGKIMAEVREAQEIQDYAKAAELASDLYTQHLPTSDETRAIIQESIQKLLASNNPKDGVKALQIIKSLPSPVGKKSELFPNLLSDIDAKLTAWGATRPAEAIQFLKAAQRLYPDNESLAAKRIPLVEQWHAANPQSVEAAVELATIREEQENYDAITPLLLPHQANLGATEGARLLGQSFSAAGRYEEAHALLLPYVKDRLEKLTSLEERLENYTDSRWDYYIGELERGKGPKKFYQDYDRAPEDEQNMMVSKYVWDRIEKEALYQKLSEEYQASMAIVPVALDLGIVHLNRAQGFADPQEREAELTRAENTFLAIRNVAGETDEYKLFLGQVKYWLGKKDEGKPLLEQVLAANPKNIYLAINVSGTLRELGDWDWAREIVETSYKQASNDEERYAAAHQRAYLQTDNDDRIVWLERADSRDPMIQIEINSTKGRQALIESDKDTAERYLKKAAGMLAEMPANASRHNNLALIYFDLFAATGDLQHHHEGVSLMKEAIKLEPGDSILLGNIIHTLLEAAQFQLAAEKYSLEEIQGVGSGEYLSFLYNNQQQKDALIAKWNALPEIQAALPYSEKLILLSPESVGSYTTCASLYYKCDDATRMEKLSQKLDENGVNEAALKRNWESYLERRVDESFVSQTRQNIDDLKARLAKITIESKPKLYAFLLVNLVSEELDMYQAGFDLPPETIMSQAEAAWKLDPTVASEGVYQTALAYSIHSDLVKHSPNYARLNEEYREALGPNAMLAWVLSNGSDDDRKFIELHSLWPQLVDRNRDSQVRFPKFPNGEEWLFIRKSDPLVAAAMPAQYEANQLVINLNKIYDRVSKFNESTILDTYWTLLMLGDNQQAEALLQERRREGVKLPL